MSELDLYKFSQDKEMDWRGDKLIMWFDHYDLKDFAELIGDDALSDGGLEIILLQGGMIAVELNDVCEWFDIEPERILEKEAC
ncbi:hypothetical protein D3C79_1063010 [compost metagenome]